ILILAAIPHGGLRLDKEIREIESAIRRADKREVFEIKVKTAIRPRDIRRAISEERPQIVHFCGHGIEDGSLVLEDDGERDIFVSPEGLAELFELHKNYVNCVVFNACHSAIAAASIVQHIDYAIGMNKPIGDASAIVFAEGFYDGLGYKNIDEDIVERAFKEGKAAVALQYPKEKETLVLRSKKK
ncbi:MAG: CHAT domain-containing protein, partial [Tolypothrix sp. Co-bin9]|nr:CHAT domain-containing protein [Tolypothrix sp. Co-bin9]